MGEWKTLAQASGTGWKEIYREAGSGWKALEWASAYEDFTTFTEVDVGADRIQKTAYHIDHLAYRNETTYLYKDYGVAHFGNFTHKNKVKAVSPTVGCLATVWMLANDLGDAKTLIDNNKTFTELIFYRAAASFYMYLREAYNGTLYYSNASGYSYNTWYYPRIVKSGTSVHAYIYTNSDYTGLKNDLSLTLHANHTFCYLYGCNTYNDGSSANTHADIENFDLG
jgi:hypothetical protein